MDARPRVESCWEVWSLPTIDKAVIVAHETLMALEKVENLVIHLWNVRLALLDLEEMISRSGSLELFNIWLGKLFDVFKVLSIPALEALVLVIAEYDHVKG